MEEGMLLKRRFYRLRRSALHAGQSRAISGQSKHARSEHDADQRNEANLPVAQLGQLQEHPAPARRRNKGQQSFKKKDQRNCSPDAVAPVHVDAVRMLKS